MNSNGQILSEINELIDDIRSARKQIDHRKKILSSLRGCNQENPTMSIDGLNLDISYYNRGYTYTVKDEYKLAATFIKKGLNAEIEALESKVSLYKERLNEFNIGNMV